MKLLSIILLLYIMISGIFCSWTVQEISEFPHLMHTPFQLQFLEGENNNKTLMKFKTEAILVTIRDKKNFIVEKYVFNYGYQYSIDEELIGNFIDIPIWQRDINSTIINITIQFKKDSNSKFIEIFHLPANTIEIRKKMFKNLKIANRIYSKRINLLIPSKLELFVKSINQSNDELLISNEIAIAVCRAYDGIPKEKPIFTNHNSFNVTKSEYNIERNKRTLWLSVSLSDHLKNLTCNAGNVSISVTMHVLHNPTYLYMKPEFYDVLQTNQTITCYAIDGYPRPNLRWHFVKGPLDASKFYSINKSELFISSNIPVGSMWEFKCNSENKASANSTFTTISFSIIDEEENIIKYNKDVKIDKYGFSRLLMKKLNKRISSTEGMLENIKINQAKDKEILTLKDSIDYLSVTIKQSNNIKEKQIKLLETILNNQIKQLKNEYGKRKKNDIFHSVKQNNLIESLDNENNKTKELIENFINQTKIDNRLLQNEYKEKIDLLKKKFENLIKEKSIEIENQKKSIEDNKGIIEIIKNNFTSVFNEMKIQMKADIQSIVNRYKLNKNYDNELIWNINNIHDMFKDIKLVDKIFHNIKNIEYITIFSKFFHHEIVVDFSLYIAHYTALPKDLDVTIKLLSALNKDHYVMKTKEIKITDRHFRSSKFGFLVNDLSFAGVVNTNALIIKCYLLWI